jgi:tripartite-type tricarboxylate transporter receptor subunit TctC
MDRITGMGYESIGNSPAEFGVFVRAETARWSKVIKEAGIRIE